MIVKVTLVALAAAGLGASLILAAPKGALPQGQSGVNGLPPAASAPSFMPAHVTGPHAGKGACPLCVYGNAPQLQIWAQEPHLARALELARKAEKDLAGKVQAYIVLVPVAGGKPKDAALEAARTAGLKSAFITYVPSWTDEETSGLYNHTEAVKPDVRVYSVVNRRLYSRWENPKDSDWPEVVQKVKDSAKYKAGHDVTDRQIVPEWEEGQPFKVVFEVFDKSGKPLSNAKVTAWQTDATGLYNPRSFGHVIPRLQVTAWTDSKGRIEFSTIYPAPYPDGSEPSHIHFAIPVEGKNQWRTLWFEGDPILTPEKRKWEEENEETVIVKVDKSKRIWTCSHRYIVQ